MNFNYQLSLWAALSVLYGHSFAAAPLAPMLDLPGTGEDAARIDFTKLPMLKGQHALVTRSDKTNFPDATSKFFCLCTSRGFYVIISNANPAQRNPLCLSTSDDGVTFTCMARLPIPDELKDGEFVTGSRYGSTKYESFQYPHAIERDGQLLIAFSRKKQTVEAIKVTLDELDRLRNGK
jgi:hypothetical protein